MFIRILFCSTGLASSTSGLYLLIAALLRINHNAHILPRTITTGFIILFLLATFLKGICWFVLGWSNRLWENKSGNTGSLITTK